MKLDISSSIKESENQTVSLDEMLKQFEALIYGDQGREESEADSIVNNFDIDFGDIKHDENQSTPKLHQPVEKYPDIEGGLTNDHQGPEILQISDIDMQEEEKEYDRAAKSDQG